MWRGASVLGDFNLVAVGDEAAAGSDADVGVAAEVLAAFDGFEEKALGLGSGQAKEGGDRSFKVRSEGAVERDEGVGTSEAEGTRRERAGRGAWKTGYRSNWELGARSEERGSRGAGHRLQGAWRP